MPAMREPYLLPQARGRDPYSGTAFTSSIASSMVGSPDRDIVTITRACAGTPEESEGSASRRGVPKDAG
jgi:hypothetical protein